MCKYDKLNFHHSPSEGEFDWGNNRSEIFERFYDAVELLDKDVAESEFIMIIEDDPEFIDAYNSLGWIAVEEFNYGIALYYFQKALKIGTSLIPKGFKGEIDWGIIDNRPFLRAIEGVGLSYLSINRFEQALKYFEKTLEYNSHDNQGMRAEAIHCYIALGEFKSILKINRLFPDDEMPDTMYGKVYALYHLQKIQEAEKALVEALQFIPLVAKELSSQKHKPPLKDHSGFIAIGGQYEAYDYWRRLGQYWTNPQLKEFLKNGLMKITSGKKKWLTSRSGGRRF